MHVTHPKSCNSCVDLDLEDVVSTLSWNALHHVQAESRPKLPIWWYREEGGTDTLRLDAELVMRLQPLMRSRYLQHHFGGILKRFADQAGIPRGKGGRILWQVTGKNKAWFAEQILRQLADKLEAGVLPQEWLQKQSSSPREKALGHSPKETHHVES